MAGMILLPTVPTSAETFDFSKVGYVFYRRFIELLMPATLGHMRFVNKFYYEKCLTVRGMSVVVIHRQKLENVQTDSVFSARTGCHNLHVAVASAEQYLQFEQVFSKFLPYFNFECLVADFVDFSGSFSAELDPVPKTYTRLVGKYMTQFSHVDNFVTLFREEVTNVELVFNKLRPETCLTFCNYLMKKLPKVKAFTFELKNTTAPTHDLFTLMMVPEQPPAIRFLYSSPSGPDKTYKNGQWVDTNAESSASK